MRKQKKKKYTTSEDEDTELDGIFSSPEGSQTRGKAAGKKNKLTGKKKGKKPRVSLCSIKNLFGCFDRLLFCLVTINTRNTNKYKK